MKLNLGSGISELPRTEWTNVDLQEVADRFPVDTVWDLNVYPYPWKDNSIDEIRAMNVMEHLKEPQKFLEECYRILKPNSKIFLQVPIYGTWSAAHINHPFAGFSPYSFLIIEQERWGWEFRKCPFIVESIKVATPFSWRWRFPWRFAFVNMFVNNVFSQMFVTLKKGDDGI